MRLLAKALLLSLFLQACATMSSIDTKDIHFPRFADQEDRVVVPASVKGRLTLNENCLIVKTAERDVMVIWDYETTLSRIDDALIISQPDAPERKPLKLGSKVNLYGSMSWGDYTRSSFNLRETAPAQCQDIQSVISVASW